MPTSRPLLLCALRACKGGSAWEACRPEVLPRSLDVHIVRIRCMHMACVCAPAPYTCAPSVTCQVCWAAEHTLATASGKDSVVRMYNFETEENYLIQVRARTNFPRVRAHACMCPRPRVCMLSRAVAATACCCRAHYARVRGDKHILRRGLGPPGFQLC